MFNKGKKNKENKLDLSFINEKTIKVFGPLLAMLIGILILLIANLIGDTNKNTDTDVESPEEVVEFSEDEGKELHQSHDHSAQVDDAFVNSSNSYLEASEPVTVNGLRFENPVSANYAVQEKVNAQLIAANDKALLFKAYGDTNYYHEKTYNRKVNLGGDISHSAICKDGRHVVYASLYERNNPVVYVKDISSERIEEFFKPNSKEAVTSIYCDEKKAYFTITKDSGGIYTKVMALTKYLTELKPSESKFTVSATSNEYAQNSKGVYVYIPGKKTLHHLNAANSTVNDIKVNFPLDFQSIGRFSLNDSNDLLLDYEGKDGLGYVSLNGEKFGDYQSVVEAYWYDNENILILDETILYLYHVPSKTNTVLKNYVQYSVPSHDGIYYLDTFDGLMYLKEI